MRIKELREQKNISQTELAKHIGVVRSTICQYEKNNRQPDTETLSKLADYFEVSIDYLLGRGSITTKEKTLNKKILSKNKKNPPNEWTEADKEQGIGEYPTYLSEAETEWQELRSEILRIHGEEYLNTLITMLKALTKNK